MQSAQPGVHRTGRDPHMVGCLFGGAPLLCLRAGPSGVHRMGARLVLPWESWNHTQHRGHHPPLESQSEQTNVLGRAEDLYPGGPQGLALACKTVPTGDDACERILLWVDSSGPLGHWDLPVQDTADPGLARCPRRGLLRNVHPPPLVKCLHLAPRISAASGHPACS